MSDPFVDWIPLDLDAVIATETITVSTFGLVTEDGVERRRETGTTQLEGYSIQQTGGMALLEPGGLRADIAPTLYGPDTDLIQVGTEIKRDRTGERFRVNTVAHEIQWLVAGLDNIA